MKKANTYLEQLLFAALIALAIGACAVEPEEDSSSDDVPSYPTGDEIMVNGGTVSSSVDQGDIRQHSFEAESGRVYTVTITTGTNDPDLYVCSTSPCTTSNSSFGSSVVIGTPDEVELTASNDSTIYVGIRGFGSGSNNYSVEVTTPEETELEVDGDAVSGSTYSSESSYFTFETTSGEDYIVTISGSSAYGYLYLCYSIACDSYDDSAYVYYSTKTIEFTASQSQYWLKFAASADSSYTIRVEKDLSLELSDLSTPEENTAIVVVNSVDGYSDLDAYTEYTYPFVSYASNVLTFTKGDFDSGSSSIQVSFSDPGTTGQVEWNNAAIDFFWTAPGGQVFDPTSASTCLLTKLTIAVAASEFTGTVDCTVSTSGYTLNILVKFNHLLDVD